LYHHISSHDNISADRLIEFVDYIFNLHHDDQVRLSSLDVVLTVKHILMFGCFESKFTLIESFALLIAGFIRGIAAFRVKNKNRLKETTVFEAEVRLRAFFSVCFPPDTSNYYYIS
jgi:hypothetical protein